MQAFGRARHGSLLFLSLCVAWLCKASGEGYPFLSWLSSVIPANHDGTPIDSHVFQEWDDTDIDTELPTVSNEPIKTSNRTLKGKKNPLKKAPSAKAPSAKAPSAKAPSAKKKKGKSAKAPSLKAPSLKAPSFKAPGSGKGSKKSPTGDLRRRHRRHRH